jgi:hypothetical protein
MVESKVKEDAIFDSSDAAAYLTEKSSDDKKLITGQQQLSYSGQSSGESSINIDASNIENSFTTAFNKLLSGEMPSNRSINEFIDNANRSLGQHEKDLSYQGRRLVMDLKGILNSGKSFLNNTNADERLQKFIREATEFTKDLTDKGQYAAKKVEKTAYNASEEAQEMIYNLKDLLVYIIRSGEFRQLLDDFVLLFRNIGGNFEARHKRSLKQSIKSDINKEDTSASATKSALKDVQKDIQEGNLIDENVKNRIYNRFEKLMDRLTSNKEYNKAVNNLFNIVDYFNRRFDQLQKDPNLSLQDNENFNAMLDDAQFIIGEFCGSDNWQSFKKDFWSLWQDIRNDKQANSFFSDLKSFVNDSIDNPERFKKDSERQKLQNFVDRAFNLFNRKSSQYGDRFNDLWDNIYDMFDYASGQTADLQYRLNKFASDLVTDSQGRPSLYVTQDSLNQFKKILVPIMQEGLANIPLPKVSGSNDTYDWSLENITFDSRGILPEHFYLRVVSDLNLDSNTNDNKFCTQLQMKIENIDMAFKGVKFYYLRKSLPSIEDHGIADCFVRGLKFGLTWQLISEQDQPIKFRLSEVKTRIDDLEINVLESDHSIIDSLITTFFPGYIKDQVASSLVGTIRSSLEPFSYQMNEYFKKQKEYWDENLSASSLMDAAQEKLQDYMGAAKSEAKYLKQKGQELTSNASEKINQAASSVNQWVDEKIDWHSHWKSDE